MTTKQAAEARPESPRLQSASPATRKGRLRRAQQVDDAPDAGEAGFVADPTNPSIAVVLGEGVRVGVRNGQLHVSDRRGWYRRERSWARAGSELRRIVVGAGSGIVTVDAITWCQSQGVALIVLDIEGNVELGPGPYAHDETPLRRIQVTASEELAVSIAAGLIRSKVLKQAAVSEKNLARADVASALRDAAAALEDASNIEDVRRIEARATTSYFGAWVEHPAVVPRFKAADAKHVPAHWCHYDRRRSLSAKGNPDRKAERPTNTVLNYLYRIAAIEARLACVAAGLAPGLGVLQRDASVRDSLVLDVLEPVRPEVDRFVLELLAETTFTRRDFIEQSDGTVRLGDALTRRLVSTMPMWERAVAPYAEQVADTFGEVVAGQWKPDPDLIRCNARMAAAVGKNPRSNGV